MKLSSTLDRLSEAFLDLANPGQPLVLDGETRGNLAFALFEAAEEARALEKARDDRDHMITMAGEAPALESLRRDVAADPVVDGLIALARDIQQGTGDATNVVSLPRRRGGVR